MTPLLMFKRRVPTGMTAYQGCKRGLFLLGNIYDTCDGVYLYAESWGKHLRAGYNMINTPEAPVLHWGVQTFAQGKMVVRKTYQATSAAYMKYLRLGDVAIMPTLVYIWAFQCINWKDLLLLRKRNGLGRFLYYGWGLLASFCYPIDRSRRVYLSPQKQMSFSEDNSRISVPLSD